MCIYLERLIIEMTRCYLKSDYDRSSRFISVLVIFLRLRFSVITSENEFCPTVLFKIIIRNVELIYMCLPYSFTVASCRRRSIRSLKYGCMPICPMMAIEQALLLSCVYLTVVLCYYIKMCFRNVQQKRHKNPQLIKKPEIKTLAEL